MLLLSLSSFWACTSSDTQDSGVQPREFSDCDPIAYDYCALPYPSSFYLREDPTTPTGLRVHLGATTMPKTDNLGDQPDPTYWNELDGFSPWGPILARFRDLDISILPSHETIGDSLADDSRLILFDADTGERKPVWAELDMSGQHVEGKEFLFMRPAEPLSYGHRYIVALRNLVDVDGNAIAPSDGYAALRDGTATDNWDIEGRRDLYAEIFDKLTSQGWDPAETVLSWDFTVGSKQGLTGKAVWMRDDALSRVGTTGPAYTIDSIQDDYDEHIQRVIMGSFTGPMYTERDRPGTLLTRDENGMPYYNGDTEVPFTILIPRSAATRTEPLKLLQYGHGLLGDQDEVFAGYLGEVADQYGYVIFATNWVGMSEEDANEISAMIVTDISHFAEIPERSQQGLVNAHVAAAMMMGGMANDDAMQLPDANGVTGPVYDPSEVWYYGNSQGAILGGAYTALSPFISRATLGVGGGPYSLLLSRSADFSPFFLLFEGVYHDQEDISFWMALMQNLWDQAEPAGYAEAMIHDPIDGTPPKQILLQDAIGDAQVTTLGAANLARAYDATLIGTPVRDVWGLDTQPSGWTGSALVEYDHGAPDVPFTNVPPDSTYDTHEDTRRTPEAQHQMDTFFRTGTVVDYCDGVCDPH